jgi:hypothetical protein
MSPEELEEIETIRNLKTKAKSKKQYEKERELDFDAFRLRKRC